MKSIFKIPGVPSKNGLSTDYEGRCGKCHAFIGEEEFCRYCGTRRGEGEFKPYDNTPQCVYGPPPVRRLHTCPECGFEWENCVMLDRQRYCPKCGSRVSVAELHDRK